MLERTFYMFGVAAFGTYLVKEVAHQTSRAKARKQERAIEQFRAEASALKTEAKSDINGLMPQIELSWEQLDKSTAERLFATSHQAANRCNDLEECQRQYLRELREAYTVFVTELRTEKYRNRLMDTQRRLGLSGMEMRFGPGSGQIEELRQHLDDNGLDVKEIARQFT